MRKLAIVTDSSACIPKDLVEQHGLYVVPLSVIFGHEVYRDGIDLTTSEFYQKLRRSNSLPTTSSPATGDYLVIFTEAAKRAERIICICPPIKFSAATSAALSAREINPDIPVHVVSCPTAAAGQGLVVLAAARAVDDGQNFDDVVALVERIGPRVHLFAMLDTLDYLRRSGRVPNLPALAASLLGVKPMFYLKEGKASLLEAVRSRAKAINKLCDLVAKYTRRDANLHLAVFHADALQDATILAHRVACRFSCAELYITEFTPVMGVHTGPGLIGIAFYAEE